VKAIVSQQFQDFTVGHRIHAQGPQLTYKSCSSRIPWSLQRSSCSDIPFIH
jgi:hypothetical protein